MTPGDLCLKNIIEQRTFYTWIVYIYCSAYIDQAKSTKGARRKKTM